MYVQCIRRVAHTFSTYTRTLKHYKTYVDDEQAKVTIISHIAFKPTRTSYARVFKIRT